MSMMVADATLPKLGFILPLSPCCRLGNQMGIIAQLVPLDQVAFTSKDCGTKIAANLCKAVSTSAAIQIANYHDERAAAHLLDPRRRSLNPRSIVGSQSCHSMAVGRQPTSDRGSGEIWTK